MKELDEKDFEAWRVKHHEASVALDNREDKLHDIYEEIERNMTLIGDWRSIFTIELLRNVKFILI